MRLRFHLKPESSGTTYPKRCVGLPREPCVHGSHGAIVENRLHKTSRLLPGEPLPEVSDLAMIYDAEVGAYCLQLLSAPDEPALAEYWFGSVEQAERQAAVVFGARFVGWREGTE